MKRDVGRNELVHYHRGIKQFVGVDRCFARKAVAQRNHIGLALRAFLRIERHRFLTGIGWFEAKVSIIRDAMRAYLAKPIYTLNPTAQLLKSKIAKKSKKNQSK